MAVDEGWGPDAKVELTVGGVIVSIAQHTEGRGECSNAMFDLSVSCLANVVDSVGGWASLVLRMPDWRHLSVVVLAYRYCQCTCIVATLSFVADPFQMREHRSHTPWRENGRPWGPYLVENSPLHVAARRPLVRKYDISLLQL